MINNDYKSKISNIINTAKEKGLIKTYSEFCNTEESNLLSLAEEDVVYYTSNNLHRHKVFNIGDIVFVSNYIYKNGASGKNHIFVIIGEEAVNINYFGLLLSSQLTKSTYKYNEPLDKDNINNLHKNSIVKCDDLITISEAEIQFKIGEVTQNELERFIETYEKYLNEA